MVAYLGTTPSLFVAPPVQTAGALDYEALDEELAGLNVVIQRSQKQDGKERGRGTGRMEGARLWMLVGPSFSVESSVRKVVSRSKFTEQMFTP